MKMDILNLKMDLFKKVCLVSGLGGIVPGSFSIYDVAQKNVSWTQAIEALQFRQGLLDSFSMITAMGVLAILCHLLYMENRKEESYYFLEARTWFIFCAVNTLIIIIIPEAPGDWAMLDDLTDLYPLSNAVQNLRKGVFLQGIPGFIESLYSLEIIHMLRDESPLTTQEIVDRCQRRSPLVILDSMESPRFQKYPQSLNNGGGGYKEQQLRDFNYQVTHRKYRKFFREFIMEKLGDNRTYEHPNKRVIKNFLKDLCECKVLKNINGEYMLFPAAGCKYHQMGEIAETEGDLVGAEDNYEKALEIFGESDYPPLLLNTLICLGILCREQRKLRKSVAMLGEAFKIAKKYQMEIDDKILTNLRLNLENMGEEHFAEVWHGEFNGDPPLHEIREAMESVKRERLGPLLATKEGNQSEIGKESDSN